MHKDDASYYRQRAATERALARNSAVPEAGRVHHQLADAYLEKVANRPVGPTE